MAASFLVSPHGLDPQDAGREQSASGAVLSASLDSLVYSSPDRKDSHREATKPGMFPYGAEAGLKPKGSGCHVHAPKCCAKLDDVMTMSICKELT